MTNANFFNQSGQIGDSQSLLAKSQYLFMRHAQSTSNIVRYSYPENFEAKYRDAQLTEVGV